MSNHVSSNASKLTVYSASAGSGKTHQLTGEYLQLLFSSPLAYKHILAVTFTNKATEEMKSRIIVELSNLASGRKSDYLARLTKTLHKPETKVRELARQILVNILHDYSAFSISTIDRFFQQTMRAFTREIGLGGGYNVELDTSKVLGEAIDSMLFDLEKANNRDLLDWLIRFSEEKVENGETWNIRNDIQSLSTEIFKESYKEFSDDIQIDIANKELLDEYKKMLLLCIVQFEKKSSQIGEKALNIMTKYDLLPEDFKGGSNSQFKSFLRWAEGEVKEPTDSFKKFENDISNWYTKTTSSEIKSKMQQAYDAGLNDCIVEILQHYNSKIIYQTAFEINRYFFTLGILGDVDKKIREYAAENNIMLISDTTELLNKIIKGTDTPFIYEKVGTYIDHYMIDEFQDTSGMQWNNFLPLLKDSLASDKENLIVGDVKQSIYRWRNSDWKLLDEQIDIDFKSNGVTHKNLDTNWRSLSNIIDFNNAIFQSAPNVLQQLFNKDLEDVSINSRFAPLYNRIAKAYENAYQFIPSTSNNQVKGNVGVHFIEAEDEKDWKSIVLDQLPLYIEDLQKQGFSLRDIAILVRTKKEGAEIANCLLDYKDSHPNSTYKYDIISDEALFIKNSKSIKLIISLLRYLKNTTDATLKALSIYEYYKFKNQLSAEDTLKFHVSVSDNLPDDVEQELLRIRELPLYEMTEEIFDLFNDAVDKNEHVYIQAFLDMVLEFSSNKSSDLDSFLRWWDETGQKQTIFTPDGQDAIRIMTIHKSKGLGFKSVIIPFCEWDIDHKQTTILWCQPHVDPFDKIKLVPVKYSSKLKDTIFSYEYFDEKIHAFIDNLNLLYVAFTRAKENLLVFSPKPKDIAKEPSSISSLLWRCISSKSIDQIHVDDKSTIDLEASLKEDVFMLEDKSFHKQKDKQDDNNKNELTISSLASIPFDSRLKLRLNNKYFFTDSGKREYGTLMHEIVSRVSVSSDLERVVQSYRLAGEIDENEENEILTSLDKYLNDVSVSKWYSGEYKVLNEVQILQPNGVFIRPDRVMINKDEVVVVDYKFGEKEDKKYHRQVKNYMNYISKMGYQNIHGFLCYISLGKVIEVL